jgi:glutamate N-acetyltransferase/amino-acid N-acetyltransferase
MRDFQNLFLKTDPEKLHGWSFSGNCKRRTTDTGDSMKKIATGMSSVPGFFFSAYKCGIRYENKLDFCLIFSQKPCVCSGMFTTNKVFAAPVKVCRERISNTIHGILINSTNANACTGEQGYDNVLTLTAEASRILNIPEDSLMMASTGIIGKQLPVEKMISSLNPLISALSAENGSMIPLAIMTTDTKPKETAREIETSIGTFRIAGSAKGSGMIAPNMATMLSFMITDAPIKKETLDRIFRSVVDRTFNAITIDGDMSTNDTALILSPISERMMTSDTDIAIFSDALFDLCKELSVMLVQDAEGGTKCVTVTVKGADNEKDAKRIAKSIAQSLLVKTAFFGCDPNWGRIACAAGYSDASFDAAELMISIDNCDLIVNGEPVQSNTEKLASIMKNPSYEVVVTVGKGSGVFSYLTSDISYDYVKINADYST